MTDKLTDEVREAFASLEESPEAGQARIDKAIKAIGAMVFTTYNPETHDTTVGLLLPVGDGDVRFDMSNEHARELASHLMDAAIRNISITPPKPREPRTLTFQRQVADYFGMEE